MISRMRLDRRLFSRFPPYRGLNLWDGTISHDPQILSPMPGAEPTRKSAGDQVFLLSPTPGAEVALY